MIIKQRKGIRWLFAVLLLAAGMAWSTGVYADQSYGDDAYAYMEYLQGTYPNRAVAYPNLAAAAVWLKQEITGMGYEYAEQPFSIPKGEGIIIEGENIIFSKSGADDRVILVGAHYDSVLTNGTDDNATGVGLLLETAKRLASNPNLPFTVRFVLFSAEEPGCYGSQYYVDNLSLESRQQIVCMINLDTIGAGDFMYLYGGGLDESGQPIRTWAVEQALQTAENLGLAMSYHPDVNAQFPVPTKNTASDHQAFDRAGIPYIYFEASNWNGEPYTNFYQTSNPAVEGGKMMHVEACENLSFYNQTFGTRVYDHLKAYSTLLDYLLNNLVPDMGAVTYEYEDRDETVWAVSDVRIRSAASTASEVLDVLEEGESIKRTGYHEEWCRVLYGTEVGYIKTEYLTAEDSSPSVRETDEEETQAGEMTEEATEALTEETEEMGETEETDETKESEEAEAASGETAEETQENSSEEPSKQDTKEETMPQSSSAAPKPSAERTDTGGQDSLFGNLSIDTVTDWMEGNETLRIGLIAGIIGLAFLLCILIFVLRHTKKR